MASRKRPLESVSGPNNTYKTPKKTVSNVPQLVSDYMRWGPEETCQYLRREGLGEWEDKFRDACALIDWLTVHVDERAIIEDVANHWWVNWGYEESVCACPSSPQQECPSPLLARYIEWQNRVATVT